jgi:hypothetical protein
VDRPYKAVSGKTYSLFGVDVSTDEYFITIRKIAERLLDVCRDQRVLLLHVQKAGGLRFKERPGYVPDDTLIAHIRETLHEALHPYTRAVKEHLKSIPLSQRLDKTVRTREEGYHLYMLEIELVNRIYREDFRKSGYKVAFLPHCLRDFRPRCRSAPGDIEHVCMDCTDDCFINLGSQLLKK